MSCTGPARIAASGHGGQVVVSAAMRAFVNDDLTELGEHRLKGFDEAVALFQLGSEPFPPLTTISNTNLPGPVSSFVGRTRERDELLTLLRNESRLVTLSDPGGSGKTRLAVETAADLNREEYLLRAGEGLRSVRATCSRFLPLVVTKRRLPKPTMTGPETTSTGALCGVGLYVVWLVASRVIVCPPRHRHD